MHLEFDFISPGLEYFDPLGPGVEAGYYEEQRIR